MKKLKDFKLNEWFEAADGCNLCGAKYKVRIIRRRKNGNYGTIEWTITHSSDCSMIDSDEATESSQDIAGWEFMPTPLNFRGKEYYPLKAKANIGPCLECWRLIVDVPLILFIDEGRKGELDFCFECANKLKI